MPHLGTRENCNEQTVNFKIFNAENAVFFGSNIEGDFHITTSLIKSECNDKRIDIQNNGLLREDSRSRIAPNLAYARNIGLKAR